MNNSKSESPSQICCLVTGLTIAILSVLLAIIGAVLTAWLADKLQWTSVDSWALLHGTGVIVMMGWGLVGFHLISYLAVKYKFIIPTARFGVLPHLVYVSAALASHEATSYFMWLAIVSGLVAVILKTRGTSVKPFGLVVFGLLVTSIYLYQWVYMHWFFPITAS
ncbi:MAG: hypothetical protein JKY76_04375 [Proteobacteria bacterium]|nr:hypothetical protein [Pseudomonadota bacterium]